MPCTDCGPSAKDYQEQKYISAALCSTLSVLEEKSMLDLIDYQESGVPKEWLLEWWNDHKRMDELRRQAEQEKKNRDAIKQEAIKKLSTLEIEVLGLEKTRIN